MARKLVSGKSIEVRGLRELEARIRDIVDDAKGPEVRAAISGITRELRMEVAASAMSKRVPHEVLDDIFSYDKPHPADKGKGRVTALVGIRKKGRTAPWAKAYVEWNPQQSWIGVAGKVASGFGGSLTNRGAKAIRKGMVTGRRIGESLATMWELGTSKMPPRPFFRPVISSARLRVMSELADAYRKIILRHSV